MKTITSSLVHRVAPPEAGVSDRFPALILLHGRGADEEDLMGLGPYFDDRLMLVAARAPFPFPYGGYTWYDVGEVGAPEPRMFEESCRRLTAFIDDVVRSYPVDPSRLFLLGFSMGTVMSYAMSLTRPELFRGVAANSGYIPEKTHLAYRWNDLADLNVHITHGTEDPVIPVQMGRRTRDLFAASTARFVYREYPMGHEISEQSLTDVVNWMAGLL